MRKKAKYIVTSLLLFCFATSVKAEGCPYEKQVELNKEASTVKAVYEEIEIDTGITGFIEDEPDKEVKLTEKGFKIKLLNVTDNISVSIVDESDEEAIPEDYYSKDADENGVITVGEIKADQIHTYKITVDAKGGDTGECAGKNLRTFTLMTPMYNPYSELSVCDEYPDFQYCQEYSTSIQAIGTLEFYDKLEKYQKISKSQTELKEKAKKEKEKKNKKILYIAGGCILVVGVATAAIIVIRRRSRLI